MQKFSYRTLICPLCAGSLALAAALTSCSDKEEPSTIPAAEKFSGELVTSIPEMPDFPAITCDDTAEVIWENPEQTEATVKLGAFDIATGMSGYVYNIGEMTITEVICQRESDGSISLNKAEFECQAGNFSTTGSLEGSLDNGQLTLTLVYKPGSMPFDVKSVFHSKQ